jgi:hypothetical protein
LEEAGTPFDDNAIRPKRKANLKIGRLEKPEKMISAVFEQICMKRVIAAEFSCRSIHLITTKRP